MEIATYKTLLCESSTIFTEKASKFIAYCSPVKDKSDCLLFIEKVQKEHPKAKHLCYAYRLGLDKNNFRTDDAGEPSGTAGKPILAQIDSLELTNIIVIVVRYFGGVLLGTGGLIKAYRTSASLTLQEATILEKDILSKYHITSPSQAMYSILKIAKTFLIQYEDLIIDENASIKISVPIRIETDFFRRVKTIIEEEEPKPNVNVYSIHNCTIELIEKIV
ncbi:MAG: YigZ family protein [Saprospiraceae bacterium]|nr:YigZ family protein [Saprospiraceae bacterium]